MSVSSDSRAIAKTPNTRKGTLEICVGVVRSQSSLLWPENEVLSAWIEHVKSFSTKVNMYIDADLIPSQVSSSILNDIKSGFIYLRKWPRQKSRLSPEGSGLIISALTKTGGRCEVGDGTTFHFAQSSALLDCIYSAASRGIEKILTIDTDEFLVANVSLLSNSLMIKFPWRIYHTECESGNRNGPFFDRFYRDKRRSIRNFKSLFNPWYVLDACPHSPNECVGGPCKFTDPKEDEFVAHVRTGRLFGKNCEEIRETI